LIGKGTFKEEEMANTNQDAPIREDMSLSIDMEALRRFGHCWEARLAQIREKDRQSAAKDEREVA
jgi:hypothetical protein